MPFISGPKNSRMTFTGTPCPHIDLAFHTDELHLAAAIREYEKAFNVMIVPHVDNPDAKVKYGEKYFQHIDNEGVYSVLIDLHVIRDGKEICPKQNLDFALLPTDLVELGALAC
jgi:hypothetical protein